MSLSVFQQVRSAAAWSLKLLTLGVYVLAMMPSASANGSPLDEARQRFEQAEQQLKAAIAAEEAAYRERDAFLSEHFQLLRESTAKQDKAAATADPLPTVNPRWQQLNAKVLELHAKRESLLERLTPAHPLVISLDDELAQATAARDAVSQLLVPETTSPAQNSTQNSNSSPSAAVVTAADKVVARFQQLEERCRTAAQEVDRLDAAHMQAAVQFERAEMSHQRQQAIASTSAGDPFQILVWGVAIVGAAFAVLCISRLRFRSPHSAAAVAKALGLPLLGVVRTHQTTATT